MSLENENSKYTILLEVYRGWGNNPALIPWLAHLKDEPKSCEELIRNGGLRVLVNYLCSEDLKVLNLTLSILANACMDADAREKVIYSDIAVNVTSIIKNRNVDSSLHCRACRLIGNLSECSWHAESLCEAGVVKPLTELLQLKTSIQTYLMAVRAVRNIWSAHEGSREEILKLEVIKAITQLLIMAKEKSAIVKKYTELIDVCFKAMCAFLVTLDPRCGEQMQGKEDKQGYKCLMECCGLYNRKAIKCLYNLCKIPECRLLLGASGAVEQLITLIDDSSELFQEMLISLCMFCREAVNRVRFRIAAGLELILEFLKKPEHEQYHSMLLHTLVQFIYDDTSITIMIKNGIIEVLVAKLTKMVTDVINEETSASKKRLRDSPPISMPTLKYSRNNLGRFSLDFHRDDWSPGSGTSVSSSPPSTPLLPLNDSAETEDIEDNNYSPVCSDAEWGDNDEEPQEEVESLKSCKSLTTEAENSCDSDKTIRVTVCDYTTLLLLSRLSFSIEPIHGLADPTTIKPLSAYIRHTRNSRASMILHRIVRNIAYFMQLVKQGFIFEMQTLHDTEQYMRQLCNLAETGGAIGELSSALLRGEEDHKLIIAVSVPFLIRPRFVLKPLLINHGGLQLIFRILSNPEYTLYENAIWSIRQLAKTLQIQPEIICKCPIDDGGSYLKLYENHPKPATVTFELDDGTTVDACRQTLCQRSDAFSAMLEGKFCEAGKRRVKLRNTSKEGLSILIQAANGASFEYKKIESLLEAVLLADKFLMADVSDILTESSVSKISHENFSRAWSWAKSNSCHELKSYCVKSFLTAKMSKNEMIQAFRDFSAMDSFDEFLEEVREIFVYALCQPI